MAVVYSDDSDTNTTGRVVYDPPPKSLYQQSLDTLKSFSSGAESFARTTARGLYGGVMGFPWRAEQALTGQGVHPLPYPTDLGGPIPQKPGLLPTLGDAAQFAMSVYPFTQEGRMALAARPVSTSAKVGATFAGGQAASQGEGPGGIGKNAAIGAVLGGVTGKAASTTPEQLKALPGNIRDVVIPEWQRAANAEELKAVTAQNARQRAESEAGFVKAETGLKTRVQQSEQREQAALDAQKLQRKELEQKIGQAVSTGREASRKLSDFKAATTKEIARFSGDMDSKIASTEAEYEKALGTDSASDKSIIAKGFRGVQDTYKAALESARQRIAKEGTPLYQDDFVNQVFVPLVEEIEKGTTPQSRGRIYQMFKPVIDDLKQERSEPKEAAGFGASQAATPVAAPVKRPTLSPDQLPTLNSRVRNTIRAAVQDGSIPYNTEEHWAGLYNELYGKYLGKNVTELAELNPKYAAMRRAYDPILRKVKPWNEYDTTGVESLIRKMTTPGEKLSFGEQRALARIRRGYGGIPGSEELGKATAPIGQQLAKQQQIKAQTLQQLNDAISDQVELTRNERTALARQIDKWRVERQAVGAPEKETTQTISRERVLQPRLKESLANVAKAAKTSSADLDEQLASAQERLSAYDKKLRRYAFARNAIAGLIGGGALVRVGAKTYEATQP